MFRDPHVAALCSAELVHYCQRASSEEYLTENVPFNYFKTMI